MRFVHISSWARADKLRPPDSVSSEVFSQNELMDDAGVCVSSEIFMFQRGGGGGGITKNVVAALSIRSADVVCVDACWHDILCGGCALSLSQTARVTLHPRTAAHRGGGEGGRLHRLQRTGPTHYTEAGSWAGPSAYAHGRCGRRWRRPAGCSRPGWRGCPPCCAG